MKAEATTNVTEGFILNLNEIRDGDIILEAGYKPHSLLIKRLTKSDYSHAMIFFENSIFEATKSGTVFTRVPNRFFVTRESDLKVLRHNEPLSEERLKEMAFFARTQIATTYSVREAIKSSRKQKPKKRNEGQFCSRLVAESLNAGGVRATSSIYYCTPADLENSELFHVVKNAVIRATPAELKHASSGEMHPKHQKATVEWTKKAKKLLAQKGIKAQSINDITQAVVASQDLKLDKLVATAMIESGFASNYDDDRTANPYRYSVEIFTQKLIAGEVDINEEVRKEISIFRLQMENLKNIRINLSNGGSLYKTIQINHHIYESILRIIKERMDILVEACVDTGISTPAVKIARDIRSSISNAIS